MAFLDYLRKLLGSRSGVSFLELSGLGFVVVEKKGYASLAERFESVPMLQAISDNDPAFLNLKTLILAECDLGDNLQMLRSSLNNTPVLETLRMQHIVVESTFLSAAVVTDPSEHLPPPTPPPAGRRPSIPQGAVSLQIPQSTLSPTPPPSTTPSPNRPPIPRAPAIAAAVDHAIPSIVPGCRFTPALPARPSFHGGDPRASSALVDGSVLPKKNNQSHKILSNKIVQGSATVWDIYTPMSGSSTIASTKKSSR